MKKFKNMAELSRAIDKLGSEFKEEVQGIVGFNLTEMESMAKRLSPSASDKIALVGGSKTIDELDGKNKWRGTIDQFINKTIEPDGMSGSVHVERQAGTIAAFVEFSTGQSAAAYLSTVEPEWRAAAKRFFVNGQGKIIGKPYLYPSFMHYSIAFEKELKEAINNLSF